MSDDLVKRLRDKLRDRKTRFKESFEAADRIEELEANLAKALLIIEAYGDDEGYIPKRVVHLWNELTGGKDE